MKGDKRHTAYKNRYQNISPDSKWEYQTTEHDLDTQNQKDLHELTTSNLLYTI